MANRVRHLLTVAARVCNSSNWARMRRSVPSSYTRGLPGRGASARPLKSGGPCLANRVRHLLTVAARVCNLYQLAVMPPYRGLTEWQACHSHPGLYTTAGDWIPAQGRNDALRTASRSINGVVRCDILRRASRRRFQHDTGSLHKALLSTRSAYPPLQRRSLLLRQFDNRCYS